MPSPFVPPPISFPPLAPLIEEFLRVKVENAGILHEYDWKMMAFLG